MSSTDTTGAPGQTQNAGSGTEKLQALLKTLLSRVDKLERALAAETRAREDLTVSATDTLEGYSDAIAVLRRSLFAQATLFLDLVNPHQSSPDPQVAAEARQSVELALQIQQAVDPLQFEQVWNSEVVEAEAGTAGSTGTAEATAAQTSPTNA